MSDNHKVLYCPKSGCGGRLKRDGKRKHERTGDYIQRYKCLVCGYAPSETNLDLGGPGLEDETLGRRLNDLRRKIRNTSKGRYVVVSAQNATPPFMEYLRNLLKYCEENEAELIIVPLRYQNPTSLWSRSAEADDWWHSDLHPYLVDKRLDLNDNLTVMSDLKIRPTAVNPLSGMQTITGGKSGIIGHPKVQLETVPTPQHKLPKIMTTTGSVTVPNYTESKAGKRGEHHHTYGACIVEIDGDVFHMRQIMAKDDGSFIDLNREYIDGESRPADRPLALVTGDTHYYQADDLVLNATYWDKDSIVNTLKPRYIAFHDLLDFISRNHHERKDFFRLYYKYKQGLDDVGQEVHDTLKFVDRVLDTFDVEALIVPSNHDEAFDKWLNEVDPKKDVKNAKFFYETMEGILNDDGTYTSPFEYWASQWMDNYNRSHFVERGESFIIDGSNVELGFHGDKGPNGSFGNIKTFDKIGVKTIIGHRHQPGIYGGVFQVGTGSIMDPHYVRGTPSGWLHTHCLLNANGKRTLINIIGRKWRLKE